MNGERSDVSGADDAADRERRPQLVAARIELISEQRRRQRGVDEARGDEVHADRRELERESSHERRDRGGGCGRDAETANDSPAAGAAHQYQRAAWPHLAVGVAGDLEPKDDVAAERVSDLV